MDSDQRSIRLYNEVPQILDECDEAGIPMALASRTQEPTWARRLIQLLGVADRFSFSEIYPTSKRKHFDALRQSSGVLYERMLFFDDEQRNITEVSELGVTCVLVDDGMNHTLFARALKNFT